MEERNFIVYKHTSPSGKIYIGITCKKPKVRWNNGNGYKHNGHFYRAIKLYGWDNILHEVLFENLNKEEAILTEKFYIALYDSTDPLKGYNITYGGDHCTIESSIEKEKIRIRMKGNKNSSKKVICLNTGEIFESQKEAQQKKHITSISKCCNNKAKSAGKTGSGIPLVWMFYDDYLKAGEETIKNKLNPTNLRCGYRMNKYAKSSI